MNALVLSTCNSKNQQAQEDMSELDEQVRDLRAFASDVDGLKRKFVEDVNQKVVQKRLADSNLINECIEQKIEGTL